MTAAVLKRRAPKLMIQRLWPHHHNDPELTDELVALFKHFPAACDEVWFCTEFGFPLPEAHERSAERMAVAAEKMRRAGILPGIQVANTMAYGQLLEDARTTRVFVTSHWATVLLWLPAAGCFLTLASSGRRPATGVDALLVAVRVAFLIGNLSYLKAFYLLVAADGQLRRKVASALRCRGDKTNPNGNSSSFLRRRS